MKNNIKKWYLTEYPNDDLGKEINPKSNFKKLLKHIPNFYEYIGVQDSLLRERIFLEFANRTELSYECILNIWLSIFLK